MAADRLQLELRDPRDAGRYLLQGLLLQRVQSPSASMVGPMLEWAEELAGTGEPLPPLGFIADVGLIAFGAETQMARDAAPTSGWPLGLVRSYDDYVVGRLLVDGAFERACDALRQYQGRDRARGLSFLLGQMRQKAKLPGVLLTPAVFKSFRDAPGEELLAEAWRTLSDDGPMDLFTRLYETLISQVRQASALLGPEDVFELEHRTALAPLSQRVALRQVLQAAAVLEAALPQQPFRPRVRQADTATRILDEDLYPVGGFSSISNRGSIESLLHSQLAYMEDERPDLFDIKYLRDELLFYSRDENQFLRRRRTFVFALFPDLIQARFKDGDLPWQRIVLTLAFTLASIRKFIDWLGSDALLFEVLFVEGHGLDAERSLLDTTLREQIANGTARIAEIRRTALPAHCVQHARRSLCHVLTVSSRDEVLECEGATVLRLAVNGSRPTLHGEELEPAAEEGPLAGWTSALESFLRASL